MNKSLKAVSNTVLIVNCGMSFLLLCLILRGVHEYVTVIRPLQIAAEESGNPLEWKCSWQPRK